MGKKKSYQAWTQDQMFLMPPSMKEWLKEDHLAWFILDVVSELDISPVEKAIQRKDARGQRPYDPRNGGAAGVRLLHGGVLVAADGAGVPGERGVPGDHGEPAAVLHDDQRVSAGTPEALRGVVRGGAEAVPGGGAGEAAARGGGRHEGEGEREQAQGDELQASGGGGEAASQGSEADAGGGGGGGRGGGRAPRRRGAWGRVAGGAQAAGEPAEAAAGSEGAPGGGGAQGAGAGVAGAGGRDGGNGGEA